VLPVICYPHKSIESINTYPQQRFVTVAPEVRLKVLDWGGTGRNLVLLAGGGNTAHEIMLPKKS
jgi:non-heme chloroperoxidase